VPALGLEAVPDSGRVICAGSSVVHLHRDCAVVFDRSAGRIRALLRTTDRIASWQRAKPLQVPLSIFFADRGVDLLHGGLTSLRGTGVLIAGAPGSGKSTLALAALLHGLDFLGDDCVAAQETAGGFAGYSVFGSSCVEAGHLARFFARAPAGRNGGGKTVLPLAQWYTERMPRATTIAAILLPRVTHAERVSVGAASQREALLALAPSSILKRAVPAGAALGRMARLVGAVPAFWLEMGPVAQAGARVGALLEELAT
jgi:hypothetical protein